MNCSNCGFETSSGEQFCPKCGADLTEVAIDRGSSCSQLLQPGTILHGNYKIEKIIKSGTTNLYLAVPASSNDTFLVEENIINITNREKTSSIRSLLNTSVIKRFISTSLRNSKELFSKPVTNQSQALKTKYKLLKSFNVPEFQKAYEHFISNNREYLVLEHPTVNSLFDQISGLHPGEDQAIDITLGVCRCVSKIHEAGYVHLNIEPGSIYVKNGQVRLFNFERCLRAGEMRPAYLSNEGFSAPEIITKDTAVDFKTDIYSIGAVLFWLISKRTLPLTATYLDILTHISSPALARILWSCVASNPGLRLTQALELQEKLTAYQRGKERDLYFTSLAVTDRGMVRDDNEDSCLSMEINKHTSTNEGSYGVYLIADGMGGQSAGEIASTNAVMEIQRTLLDELTSDKNPPSNPDLVIMAIEKANLEIYHKAQSNTKYKSMGTTVTLGLRVDNELYVGHVGDSRAYLIRQGTIKQLTHDHSIVAGLLKAGMITPEEAKEHPDRAKIYRCLGSSPNIVIDTFKTVWEEDKLILEHGDSLLFCSDGLTTHLSDDEIRAEVESASSIHNACSRLILLANQRGGTDNISIVLAMSKI